MVGLRADAALVEVLKQLAVDVVLHEIITDGKVRERINIDDLKIHHNNKRIYPFCYNLTTRHTASLTSIFLSFIYPSPF